MTIVAANLTHMAADSFVSDGTRTTKVYQGDRILIGYCGEIVLAQALCKWVLDGARGPSPKWSEDNIGDVDDESERAPGTGLLILRTDGLFQMDHRGQMWRIEHSYGTIGSGRNEANGVLFAGGTPEQAVEAACFHDSGCKLPVVSFALSLARPPKQPYWPEPGDWPGKRAPRRSK